MTVSSIAEPRHSCALAAQQTVAAIARAVPIVHAGPGCSAIVHNYLCEGNGFQGAGARGGAMIVGTNTGEREVVFGGEKKLRSTLDGALQVMDADLFVVLTGCTSELVGDDTENVVAEYRRRGVPIAFASTGGFKGTNLQGHETVVNAILDQLVEPVGERDPRLVNVLAGVPFQDPFWRGDLEAVRELLLALGLTPNILFGPRSGGLAAWKRLPSAGLTLVLSSWTGVSTAQALEEQFGVPWLHQPELPVGALGTGDFLRRLGAALDLDPALVEAVIADREVDYDHQFERVAEFLTENRCDLPARFVTVGTSYYGRGLTRLLREEFGFLPALHIVTDDPPDAFRPAITEAFAGPLGAPTVFATDGAAIRAELERVWNEHGPALVLGSAWDRAIVRDRGGLHLSVSTPVADRMVIDAGYLGYRGGWRLLEDLITARLGALV
jgi:nitrogenase molybdenum-iron protein beta chain